MENEQKQQAAERVYETGDIFFEAVRAAEKQGLKVDFGNSWNAFCLSVTEHIRYNPGKAGQERRQALLDTGDTRFGCQGVRGPN